jgi:LCP family protein required for cell wall assembly
MSGSEPTRGGSGPRGDVRLLALGLMGVVALAFAGGTLLMRVADWLVPRTHLDALVDRSYEEPTLGPDGQIPELTGIRNVLLVGVDSRQNLTPEERQAIGSGSHGSALTDTIMWVQLDADRDQVRLVSFPRDLAVNPGGAPTVKLNSLHHLGGPNLLVETLEEIVGADLDHYVELDLAGFLHLTETMGGVEVCLQSPIRDWRANIDLPAGCQRLTPAQATGFVRVRYATDEFGAGTAGRAARQQYFIRQAVGELVSAGTLTSPTRMRALIDLARQSVVVDQDFSSSQLLAFANAFRSIEPDRVIGANLPFTTSRFDDGLFYDWFTDDAERVFEALRAGTPLPDDLLSPMLTEQDVQTAEDDDTGTTRTAP